MGTLIRRKNTHTFYSQLLIFVNMQLRAYPLMSTCSKRAIARKIGRFGKRAKYSPRQPLIARIATALRISKSEAYDQLMTEREYLLRQQ
ncbi:hypothetical protein H6F44_11840 [Pseudanabaena sp. FACHB-1277]|uniref:Uncharacterized protein n=1 Tax=Pseudanabaena cinerea FACHB-1277 TaxID=2949581 RepID=A0A926UT56_9CYAN|nr:hypothetical protein [Pseudanabaena cinerea]MBD2150806.1 hypothetical protein [Pseudanabaena cinerea FACHB-1277]